MTVAVDKSLLSYFYVWGENFLLCHVWIKYVCGEEIEIFTTYIEINLSPTYSDSWPFDNIDPNLLTAPQKVREITISRRRFLDSIRSCSDIAEVWEFHYLKINNIFLWAMNISDIKFQCANKDEKYFSHFPQIIIKFPTFLSKICAGKISSYKLLVAWNGILLSSMASKGKQGSENFERILSAECQVFIALKMTTVASSSSSTEINYKRITFVRINFVNI